MYLGTYENKKDLNCDVAVYNDTAHFNGEYHVMRHGLWFKISNDAFNNSLCKLNNTLNKINETLEDIQRGL